jgi:hypothetical protein
MPGFLEERERNVVPRWRKFCDTTLLGELGSAQIKPGDPEPSDNLNLERVS